MGHNQRHIDMLFQRQNGRCHYCNCKTTIKNKGATALPQATKEHVLPRAFGGGDAMTNYVMACEKCNNKRGTSLFYCRCDYCAAIIDRHLFSPQFVYRMSKDILAHSRIKVYRDKPKKGHGWNVRQGHINRHFKTFEEAIEFAAIGDFSKKEKVE